MLLEYHAPCLVFPKILTSSLFCVIKKQTCLFFQRSVIMGVEILVCRECGGSLAGQLKIPTDERSSISVLCTPCFIKNNSTAIAEHCISHCKEFDFGMHFFSKELFRRVAMYIKGELPEPPFASGEWSTCRRQLMRCA